MRPGVCITIPYYSNLSYLDAALQSLLAQTDNDWTAIVVDDASPESGARDHALDLGDRRIRCVRNSTNLGISANFNRCLVLGSEVADIVTIFHADDVLEPRYVAAIRSAHQAFPNATCVAPRATVIDSNGRPTRTLADSVKRVLWPRKLPLVLEGDGGLARVMHGLFFYTPAVSYRVDLLPDVRFDERWKQVMDLDLFAKVLLADGSIALIPDKAYRYRRHAESASARNTESSVRATEEAAVIREIVAAAGERQWEQTVRAGRLRVTSRFSGWWSRRP